MKAKFLMLQGPHGPFFGQLADMLRREGAEVWRVGFNRGDQMFWRRKNFIPFLERPEAWPAACDALFQRHEISDLILYGDSREIHAQAIALAKSRGLRIHIFEEGYLRPYWVTYERNGSNGHSRLMTLGLAEMRRALAGVHFDHPPAPALWGDMREHVFYGALYHFFVMAMNGGYRNFRSHRGISVAQEFRLNLRRLLLMPWYWLRRVRATRRIKRGGFSYHLVLLQLEHDASFRSHSDFSSIADFVQLCIEGFAAGAPATHHLVFKAHPLEDGRSKLRQIIIAESCKHGLQNRVHFVRGGKLAGLLGAAKSAVTVNSTAGQQALWRGIPLRAFGRAVYNKPEFVSSQDLPDFFANPIPPDRTAYSDYRRFLLETSQVPGGYYAARNRRHLLAEIIKLMKNPSDPYDALQAGTAASRQQLEANKMKKLLFKIRLSYLLNE